MKRTEVELVRYSVCSKQKLAAKETQTLSPSTSTHLSIRPCLFSGTKMLKRVPIEWNYCMPRASVYQLSVSAFVDLKLRTL